jgi:hypothetical protein
MKVILIDDDGNEVVSENFLIAIKSKSKEEKDAIAVQGLTERDILSVTRIVLDKVQKDSGLPDPPELCNECLDKIEGSCTCGLDFGSILKENKDAN